MLRRNRYLLYISGLALCTGVLATPDNETSRVQKENSSFLYTQTNNIETHKMQLLPMQSVQTAHLNLLIFTTPMEQA